MHTDAVGFVSLFFLVSLSVSSSRSLLSGHRLVLRLLGSHLHRTYLLDGLILSSYFSGLVVWCLVCLFLCPVCPCGLAFGGSQDGPSCPLLPWAGCTSPAPSLSPRKKRVPYPTAHSPHSPLSPQPAVWGWEPLPPFCSDSKGSWGRNVTGPGGQSSVQSCRNPTWFSAGWYRTALLPQLPMCPAGPNLVLRRS